MACFWTVHIKRKEKSFLLHSQDKKSHTVSSQKIYDKAINMSLNFEDEIAIIFV